jgi:rhodanese-related sulfurtransferase
MNHTTLRTLLVASAFAFSGAVAAADVSPTEVDGATTIDVNKAKALFDSEAAFVDVRKDSDWEAGRIPGAIHMELKKVLSADALGAEVAKDEPVVIYCNGESCMRSSEASAMAVSWGWTQVHYFRDGFPAWKSAGMPVE